MTEWCVRGEDESPGQINSGTTYASAMHDAFNGGASVWMACDWVYPPRKGGEALIHVDWGNDCVLKKPCWVFRHWSAPREAGMRVVESASSSDGIKVTSFLSSKRILVIHVVNNTGAATPVRFAISASPVPATRQRTSAAGDAATLSPLPSEGGGCADTLPARSLSTYRITQK